MQRLAISLSRLPVSCNAEEIARLRQLQRERKTITETGSPVVSSDMDGLADACREDDPALARQNSHLIRGRGVSLVHAKPGQMVPEQVSSSVFTLHGSLSSRFRWIPKQVDRLTRSSAVRAGKINCIGGQRSGGQHLDRARGVLNRGNPSCAALEMETVFGELASQVISLTDLAKGGGSCSHNNMLAKIAESAMNDGTRFSCLHISSRGGIEGVAKSYQEIYIIIRKAR